MEEIEAFCKHAGYLNVTRFRSLEEEYSSPRIKFIRMRPLLPGGFEWTEMGCRRAISGYFPADVDSLLPCFPGI